MKREYIQSTMDDGQTTHGTSRGSDERRAIGCRYSDHAWRVLATQQASKQKRIQTTASHCPAILTCSIDFVDDIMMHTGMRSSTLLLTRQLGRVSIKAWETPPAIATTRRSLATILPGKCSREHQQQQQQQRRSSSLSQTIADPDLCRQRRWLSAAKKSGKRNKKASPAVDARTQREDSTDRSGDGGSSSSSPLQHEEWVKFQKAISVDGFETGQTTSAQQLGGGKKRGGRGQGRQKLQEDLQAKIEERQRLTDIGGGEYPPLRLSDEETERLLRQAYEAIPERTGKRGTRNLKRQEKRWHLVRKARKKVKYHLAIHQERKMQKRSDKVREVKEVLAQAPVLRERDRAYQARVLQRWIKTMTAHKKSQNTGGIEVVEITDDGRDIVG